MDCGKFLFLTSTPRCFSVPEPGPSVLVVEVEEARMSWLGSLEIWSALPHLHLRKDIYNYMYLDPGRLIVGNRT